MNYNEPNIVGYTAIPVLEFLNGEPWDDRILDFIHALRPSDVRIAMENEAVTSDARVWRVTVYLDNASNVKKIEQEVEVGLRTADNGHCLINKIPKGDWPKGPVAIVNTRAVRRLMEKQ